MNDHSVAWFLRDRRERERTRCTASKWHRLKQRRRRKKLAKWQYWYARGYERWLRDIRASMHTAMNADTKDRT